MSTGAAYDLADPKLAPMPTIHSVSPDLKQACVQAAHEVIAEKGIEHLSLRDVARKLGVSHQAPYRHYPSKDHLLAAVIARCLREFAAALDVKQHFDDPHEELCAMGEQYVAYAMQHPLEYRLMFGTSWPDAAADSELIHDAMHAFNILRNVLSRIHGEGPAARENIDLDAMYIWSGMHGLVTLSQCNAMQHLALAPEAQVKISKHVFEMIECAMKSRAAASPAQLPTK